MKTASTDAPAHRAPARPADRPRARRATGRRTRRRWITAGGRGGARLYC